MKQHRRQVLGGLAGLPLAGAAVSAFGQTPPPPVPPAPGPRVSITTAQGVIVVEVYPDRAPITAGNFLKYVDQKRYAGSNFYRALSFPGMPDAGLLQGGLAGTRTTAQLPPIAHESTRQTGLTHTDGAISMARQAPGTAQSEFFICLGDMSGLDADPSQPGDNAGYAVFGKVVEGLEVVKALHRTPVSPTKGAEFGMQGQMFDPVIPITGVKRAV